SRHLQTWAQYEAWQIAKDKIATEKGVIRLPVGPEQLIYAELKGMVLVDLGQIVAKVIVALSGETGQSGVMPESAEPAKGNLGSAQFVRSQIVLIDVPLHPHVIQQVGVEGVQPGGLQRTSPLQLGVTVGEAGQAMPGRIALFQMRGNVSR